MFCVFWHQFAVLSAGECVHLSNPCSSVQCGSLLGGHGQWGQFMLKELEPIRPNVALPEAHASRGQNTQISLATLWMGQLALN